MSIKSLRNKRKSSLKECSMKCEKNKPIVFYSKHDCGIKIGADKKRSGYSTSLEEHIAREFKLRATDFLKVSTIASRRLGVFALN